MNFGDLIHERRVALGLTLEQIGDAVGVGKSTVRKWEHGIIKNIRRDKILALANVLEINPAMLIDTRYWDDSTAYSAYGDHWSLSVNVPNGRVIRIGDPNNKTMTPEEIRELLTDITYFPEDEKNLILKYRTLNDKGKEAVLAHLEIVAGNPAVTAPPSTEKKAT